MACLGAVIGYTSGLQVCAVLHTAVAKYTVICCRCCRHAAASHQRCGMHALNTVIAAQTGCVCRGCAAAEAATCIVRKHEAAQQPYYMQAAPAACKQRESHRNAHSWNNSHDTTNRQVHQHPAAELRNTHASSELNQDQALSAPPAGGRLRKAAAHMHNTCAASC